MKEMMRTARTNKPIDIPITVHITPFEFSRVFNALILELDHQLYLIAKKWIANSMCCH